MPPPNDTPGLNVRFSGIMEATLPPDTFVHIKGVHLDGPYTLKGTGGSWSKEFNSGYWLLDDGHTQDHKFRWRITASRDEFFNWTISPVRHRHGRRGAPYRWFCDCRRATAWTLIHSIWTDPLSSYFYGGTAKVV
ncbi:MAG: hypothetical protein WDN28_10250 [Chthoniobacter sp.]